MQRVSKTGVVPGLGVQGLDIEGADPGTGWGFRKSGEDRRAKGGCGTRQTLLEGQERDK